MGGIDGGQVLRHGLFAVLIGIAGAAASVVLCLLVGFAYTLVCDHPWLLYLLPVLGVVSLLMYRAMKLPLDTTTHTVVNDIRADREISPWLAPGILLGTALSILGGASVGKEAGALHMGASLGDLIARPMRLRPVTRKEQAVGDGHVGMRAYAAATGMAACFAALFFAPLGSTAFVIELARYERSVVRHLPTMLLACFVAFALASLVGIGDIIPKVPLPGLSWPIVGQCIVIAVACALVGTLYIKAIEGLQRVTKRVSKNYYLWVALGGIAMIALVSLFGWQGFEGTGGNQLALALLGEQEPWAFAVKALLTVVCLGLWFRGGEIMPTFTIGALLGASCTVMTGGDAGWSAAVGLVAFFAAMSRCPLAAFFMGCEIFGWAGAPLFALAVAVSFSLGRDVGYYGRGATSVLREAAHIRRRGRPSRPGEVEGKSLLEDVIESSQSNLVKLEDALQRHADAAAAAAEGSAVAPSAPPASADSVKKP